MCKESVERRDGEMKREGGEEREREIKRGRERVRGGGVRERFTWTMN